jgi:hypothetical protein
VRTDGEGSSFSAPIVAGEITSLMQIIPGISADSAVKLLQKTASPVPNSKYTNYRPPSVNGSAGIINAELAAWKGMGKKIRGTSYWKGMTDSKKIGKLNMGFEVISWFSMKQPIATL